MIVEQIFNEDGTPKIVDNKFVYQEVLKADWEGFRNAFATNMSWITYAMGNPFLAARLETLVMQLQPDANVINEILKLAFSTKNTTDRNKEEWQLISDQFNINLIF